MTSPSPLRLQSPSKPSSYRRHHFDLIGARIITDLDAPELRYDLGIPSVAIPQSVCDLLIGDLNFNRIKTNRRRLDNVAATLIDLSCFLGNEMTSGFVQVLLSAFPPSSWDDLSLQIGKIQELWSPVELVAELLAVVEE